jgi:hypothetical protein
MSRSITDLLRHMLDECEYLLEQSQQVNKDAFLVDEFRKTTDHTDFTDQNSNFP